MRKPHSLFAASLALAAACGGDNRSATDNASATGGTMIVAAVGDPVHLLPPLVSDFAGKSVQDLVYDKLAEVGPDLNSIGDAGFTPHLARSWSWAPDSMSIAFSIDPRARWHDGTPVLAEDIRYAFQAFTDPKLGSPNATGLANIDSIQVRDSLTAVAWFRKRSPSQFYDVAYQLVPIPRHVYDSLPFDQLQTADGARKIVGSGPFRLVKWEPNVRIEVIADTTNYRGRPRLDRVIFSIVPDANVGLTQVLTQQADFVETTPPDQVASLDSSTVARPFMLSTFGYVFAGFNLHAQKSSTAPHPIFGDSLVRRGLSMSVDREALLQNVFGSNGRIGHGPFPMTHAVADSTIHLPAYDTTGAKALLDSAGWRIGSNGMRARNGRPLRFSILTPTTSIPRKAYAVLLQEQFRRIGAQADIEMVDNQVFTVRTRDGAFDIALSSFGTDAGAGGFSQNWGTSGIGPQGQNTLRYSNRTVDALFDSAASSFDAAKTKAYARRAFQQIADDTPAIWLYDIVQLAAINQRLIPGRIRPDGWAVDMANWSIDPARRIDRDRIGLGGATP